MMALFALFVNCLLITVLISILTNTFAQVQQNAVQIYLFERTVRTLERIKADAMLEYVPPGNLAGLLLVAPAKLFLNERYFHKLHVFVVRATSVHVLLPIALYRRWRYSAYKRRSLYLDPSRGPNTKTDSFLRSIPKGLLDNSARTAFLARQVFERPVDHQEVEQAAGFSEAPEPLQLADELIRQTKNDLKETRHSSDAKESSDADTTERLGRMEASLVNLGMCFRSILDQLKLQITESMLRSLLRDTSAATR